MISRIIEDLLSAAKGQYLSGLPVDIDIYVADAIQAESPFGLDNNKSGLNGLFAL